MIKALVRRWELFKIHLAARWAAKHGLSLLRVTVCGNSTYVHGPDGQMFVVGRKRGK